MSDQPQGVPLGKASKLLLAHEKALVAKGELINQTHRGASSVWLAAASTDLPPPGKTCVYRPMGDAEVMHLVVHGVLPATQPYQAIIEGANGRAYSEKYLRGHKRVDTHPTTVVEFVVPQALIDELFQRQHKPEDGALSMGLGPKAGDGLSLFNAALEAGEASVRIVTVKRGASK
eukprot:m.35938 g.35938  ORF g.35938 m.35938 type:complete len:175 (+) comp5752_c0_seq1:274-798(+)